MKKIVSPSKVISPILCSLFVIIYILACSSQKDLEDPPIITSATYQHTQYNGRSQPVEISAAKVDVPPFVVTYFTSEENLEKNEGGLSEAPAEVGDYYVRIERPEGNGYRKGGNIKIEYHIQKAFISITAEPVQRFTYDGKPKEALVHTEPPVDLVVTYFITGNPGDDSPLASPPAARGRYQALISFPGNERYMGASKDIEMLIE
jgi:hypothetical protein